MSKVLSIAVPSYNVERYLAASLGSYVAEGADDRLEVLIVNDGSTDGTREIAKKFCERYPQVFRLVDKENGGHGSAVNAGLREASGTYFRVIDGDDRICSANVALLLDSLEQAEEDLVVDVKREVVMGTGESRVLSLPADLPLEETLPFSQVCLRQDIEEFFMIHTLSMRTEFLRKHEVTLLEHTFYVDYELIVKVASYASTIRFLDLEACNYFVGNAEQSVAPANYVRRWDDHTRVTYELLKFADDARLSPERQLFVNNRIQLLVNTHYNISLIYDEDRERGLARADEFRNYLKMHHYPFYVAGERRYHLAKVLHHLGFDSGRLDKLMRR